MTVEELLNRISSKELTQWMLFYNIEPFGREAEDIGHAITASTIANANRRKGHKPFKTEDFMPKYNNANKPQTVEQMIQFAETVTYAMGGKDDRDG